MMIPKNTSNNQTQTPVFNDLAEDKTTSAEHVIRLPDTQWALWRWAGLRGTGFSIALAFKLADSQCAAAADEVLTLEHDVLHTKENALQAISAALDLLQDSQESETIKKRKAFLNAARSLKKNKRPKPVPDPEINVLLKNLQRDRTHLDRIHTTYDQEFEAARKRLSENIYCIASSDRFQEAVIWQNRHAFNTTIAPLVKEPPGSSLSRRHRKEELFAMYLQRYCVKNDTIGFFGPVGWARLNPYGKALSAEPGTELLAARNVYFETWCIDALAEALAQHEALLPWLKPRRLPHVHIEGTRLYLPSVRPYDLPVIQAAILRACDGKRTARAIAEAFIQNPFSGLKNQEDVYAILSELKKLRRIAWTLEVPFELHPERGLRQQLEQIGDETLRHSCLRALDELEEVRNSVCKAAGNAKELERTLETLDSTFTRLTGKAPTRRAGEMYAARTIVYEDCQRDLQVEIGPELFRSLGPPLSLLLTSARWITYETRALYRTIFRQLYTQLVQETGSQTVDLTMFWFRGQELLFEGEMCPIKHVQSAFQKRWTEVLANAPGQRRLEYTSAELAPQINKVFDASHPGWSCACYHCPDIMIAAASQEAVRQGDFLFVMGELHLGINTLGGSCFFAQHPFPEELVHALECDLPESRIVPVVSREDAGTTARTRAALVSPKDFRLTLSPDLFDLPPSRVLPIGNLVVEDQDDELVVYTRDRRLRFDLIEVFADALSATITNVFEISFPGDYMPRISIDRLVICRESWRFLAFDIPFAREKTEADCFLAARRWARSHGLPRTVFLKTPIEEKPLYVDFDSPIYVNIFAKIVRKVTESNLPDPTIRVTEMLPRLDQVWLPDAQDQRYTSEFRFVAVDLTKALFTN